MREISIKSLQPVGVLKELLIKFNDKITLCEKEGYSAEVLRLMNLIVRFGLIDSTGWFDKLREDITDEEKLKKVIFETEIAIWLGHLYFIRLNNIAQKHFNKAVMDPNHVQINTSVDIQRHYPDVIFVE
jgi:hypothetical protein